MRLVFCGTPRFAVPTLDALRIAGHSIELVLTQPDRPSGRGMDVRQSAVKQRARELQLPITQPEKIRKNIELHENLQRLTPDAIVVVAYGRLIPPWMLHLPRFGNLNLHASLLPKYRGAAPIQWAVASGETETGVTIMQLDEGLDTGDILMQKRVPIPMEESSVEVAATLAMVGARLMIETLAGLEAGTIHPAPQDHNRATLAPLLQREDGRIDWKRPAATIYNRWRGFQPWPGAFTQFRGKKMIIHSMRLVDASPSPPPPPGTIGDYDGHLRAACGGDTQVEILELQMEGKRRMPAAAFLHGASLAPGERFA